MASARGECAAGARACGEEFPPEETAITLGLMPLIHALGATVRVELVQNIDAQVFDEAWSRCLVPESDARVRADEAVPTVVGQHSMTALTQDITRALITRRAGDLLMLHAGAVSHPQTGRSIAYIAPGGTGKTTLTRMLAQDFGYLTDETVGVEPGTWRIHAYEKPLSLRNEEGGYPKTELGPDSLGLKNAHPSPVLSTLMLIRRSEEHRAAPSFTKPDLLDIIPTLVPETSSLVRLERPLHLLADLVDALGGIWLVEYAEADQLRDWVTDQLGEP